MRAKTGFVCHNHTTMVSYEDHHVWPLGYHGPDKKSNKIRICPNAHSDIHYLMDRWLKGKPVDLREYGESVRYWAKVGYDQVIAYADSLAESYNKGVP
jgi:hypothetical protein